MSVEAENPACGDRLRVWAEAQEGHIVRASFQAQGCTASMAAGSALAEWLHGQPVSELKAGVASSIENLLGGLTPETRHAAVLAADAAGRLARVLTGPACGKSPE